MVSLRGGAADAERLLKEYVLAKPATSSLFRFKCGVFHVSAGQERFRADLHGPREAPDRLVLDFVPVPRLLVPLLLPLQNFPVFRKALAAKPGGLAARFRAALIQVGDAGPDFPRSYANWIAWFDGRQPRRAVRGMATAKHEAATIDAIVMHTAAPSTALAQTLESLRAQTLPPRNVIRAGPGAAIATNDADYVAILQAGEIMPPHGLLVLAETLGDFVEPLILIADEDRLDADGLRADPLFKPGPNLTMMCSGVMARGVWLIRRDLLAELGPATGDWAECLRLRAWFHAWRTGRAARAHRVPAIMTHRTMQTEAAPPAALAEVVGAFLAEAGFDAEVTPAVPLRVRWRAGGFASAKVSLLVPSRLAGETQLNCMMAVLRQTRHRDFDMRVVVTQETTLDAAQQQAARQISAFPNATVELVRRPDFNYSAANNLAAARTNGDLICLLNDDVAPIDGDWLDRLLGFFQDEGCGIVGPRLLYPNGMTQHGGVIVGLAGLVEHANRYLPGKAPGYAGRATLDQEYSAVTGACLLVRRPVFDMVGGLDESYPVAFNDIDFCLRVRERGFGVVYAGSVDMIHHESLTFVRHYDVDDRENPDIERFRGRWSGTLLNDPFHNPNLSLKPRSEWQLAFPPRTGLG